MVGLGTATGVVISREKDNRKRIFNIGQGIMEMKAIVRDDQEKIGIIYV